MLREYLKPESIENPKFRSILEKHTDRIIKIINQDEISYGDFKRLVRVVLNKENSSEKCSYTCERELQQLYDEYRLFKRFVNNKERGEKVIKALMGLSNSKSFQMNESKDSK